MSNGIGYLPMIQNVVFATLTDAFEDNEAPAAMAGVYDSEASIVVLAPDIEAIPERMPTLTEAGNLSLAKLTKSKRNSFYAQLVCGQVLVTVREALAVAPSLMSVRVAAFRWTPPNAYGNRSIECLLAAVFSRDALQGIQWQSADAVTIVNDASAELRINQGATNELRPLDLSNEPALAALIKSVDLQEPSVSEEHDEFNVVLEDAGGKKIAVIKELRNVSSLGLKEAKDLVDGAPILILEKVSKETAFKAKAALERVGATVTLK